MMSTPAVLPYRYAGEVIIPKDLSVSGYERSASHGRPLENYELWVASGIEAARKRHNLSLLCRRPKVPTLRQYAGDG